LVIPLKSSFQITDFGFQTISSIFLVGLGFGSLMTGTLSKKWSRPILVNIFIGVILLCTIIMAFFLNFIVFAIIRFIIGFFLGLTIPLALSIATECLPLKNRALVLTGIWTGFWLGFVLIPVIMLFAMPQLEASGLTSTILCVALLELIVFVSSLLFMEDSPRNLILRDEENEAYNIIEKIIGHRLEASEKESIIRNIKSGLNSELSNDINELFNPKLINLSILQSFIWLINYLVLYGPNLITILTLKSLGQETNSTNHQIIIDQIIINLMGLPSCVLGGLICEIEFLGRKKSLLITISPAIFCLGIAIIFPHTYTVSFGLFLALVSVAFDINTSYTCEVYPTKIRDKAVGFMYFFTRIGGFISQYLYLYLNSIGIWIPYYATIVFILVNIILIIFLPFETYGKPLDIDFEKEDKQRNE
jgi:MFS family permease